MPRGRCEDQERLEVRGGDLGPTRDLAPGEHVRGEIPQDPQPGFKGDVAERVPAGAPAAILLTDLDVVEVGDGRGQRHGDRREVLGPSGRRPLLWAVVG